MWAFAKKVIMRSPNTIVSSLVFLGHSAETVNTLWGSDKIKT